MAEIIDEKPEMVEIVEVVAETFGITVEKILTRSHGRQSKNLARQVSMQRYLTKMMLFFAPTVNSWRRFVEGTFAPPAFTWGIENRTTAFRVVGEDNNSLRVENRLPCSDANPYLVTATMLAAGLTGIEEELQPTAPTVGNGYIPGTGEGEPLPADMQSAIDTFAASKHARKYLGDQFVDAYVSTRSAQLESFSDKTIIDERKRFFELG